MSHTVAATPGPPALMARNAMSPVPPATSSRANGASPFGGLSGGDHRLLPGAVQAAGHQVVHQVVAAGNGGKNVVHKALLFAQRHLPVAEMGLGCVSGSFMAGP